MELKIAICDDDALQREYLTELLAPWAKRNRHLAEIKTYSGAKPFLFDYGTEKDFDILLLDIEMPEINGIEIAKRVRAENSAVQIIFVTGYYRYFSDGFDVSALHYLLKPIDGAKLYPVLDKAVDNLSYRQRSVLLSTSDGEYKVSLADICFVESQNVYLDVHTTRGTYRTRMTLKSFSDQLDDTFFKVHRSYTVALKYIKKITRNEITMSGGETVPISRGMYDALHNALIKYL